MKAELSENRRDSSLAQARLHLALPENCGRGQQEWFPSARRPNSMVKRSTELYNHMNFVHTTHMKKITSVVIMGGEI